MVSAAELDDIYRRKAGSYLEFRNGLKLTANLLFFLEMFYFDDTLKY